MIPLSMIVALYLAQQKVKKQQMQEGHSHPKGPFVLHWLWNVYRRCCSALPAQHYNGAQLTVFV